MTRTCHRAADRRELSISMEAFLYEFEWDPGKSNFNKHGVHFDRAAQIFRDPLAVTIPDEEHSENKVR